MYGKGQQNKNQNQKQNGDSYDRGNAGELILGHGTVGDFRLGYLSQQLPPRGFNRREHHIHNLFAIAPFHNAFIGLEYGMHDLLRQITAGMLPAASISRSSQCINQPSLFIYDIRRINRR
ncbi:hypothetical protein D3C80_1682640 [compost metagenome]